MNDEITPALTAGEWRVISATIGENERSFDDQVEILCDADNLPGLIAFLNDSLPDDSPYKITRADVDLVRSSIDRAGYPETLIDLADKLAALLPPE